MAVLLGLLLIGGLRTMWVSGNPVCSKPRFKDIEVKKDFDMKQITGRTWYQVGSGSSSPVGGTDVGMRFYYSGKSFMADEAGRLSADTACASYTYRLPGSGGVFTAVDVKEPAFSSSMLLLDTDYLTYYTSYACFVVNAIGQCDAYLASIYSANPERSLSVETQAKITLSFGKLCIDNFTNTGKTGKECLQWNSTS